LPVTSHFGWRIHPIYGTWKFHSGVDLGYDYGTLVISLFDGTVISAGDYKDGYGNQVLIYHSNYDVYTRYAHLQAVYVSVGSQVSGGSYIGEVGSTGNSTGPHLHFEYIVRDANGNYVYTDPLCLF
ncbi:MAG: M23 family metallopeptidase, partial [Selenomonadaceae bacterium]|nr:M23 family metallopeptidase [Selenomonadaceae bacterium]